MFLTRNIKDFISKKHIYCMRDICYICESHKLENNNLSNTLVFNGLVRFSHYHYQLPSWSSG